MLITIKNKVKLIIKDENTTLSYYKNEVRQFVNERGWMKYHTPKNLIQALNIEVAELSEIFLFKDYKIENIIANKQQLESISDELADIFIYLISLVNIFGLDLTNAFLKKMKKNKTKYSIKEFNHGIYYKK